jgi:DNA replication and repair protein RecF
MTGLLDAPLHRPAPQPALSPELNALSVSTLSLHCFRNHTATRLETDARPVVLSGTNGAGKTSILEALSLLMPGRGLKRAPLSDISHADFQTPWAVAATVQGLQGEVMVGTALEPGQPERRLVKLDGRPGRSQAELARHVSLLWVTPQVEQLFHEGASAGRKFLDRLVYGFDAEHASRVNAYDYAMRERNRLLSEGCRDDAWLGAHEQTMAETASAIAAARLETAQNLNHAIAHSPLSFPKAQVGVSGTLEQWLVQGESAVAAEEKFRLQLAKTRTLDAAAGRALEGPHRSMLHVLHLGRARPAEACSTGEQKAVLLSMVLAQVRAQMLWKGVVPILLLDEVIAHLDTTRKLELFEEICQIGAQVWMTGTDVNFFAELGPRAQRFLVEEGKVLPP